MHERLIDLGDSAKVVRPLPFILPIKGRYLRDSINRGVFCLDFLFPATRNRCCMIDGYTACSPWFRGSILPAMPDVVADGGYSQQSARNPVMTQV